jgi:hypothetical protein
VAQGADLDVALLEVQDNMSAGSQLLDFGRIPEGSVATPFSCTGFPEAAGYKSHPASGRMYYLPDAKQFDLRVEGSLPKDTRTWGGFSGAVVFGGDIALAIVRTVDTGWTGTLLATPLEALYRDPDFKAFWESNLGPLRPLLGITQGPPDPLERISSHLHLLDRETPSIEVIEHVKDNSGKAEPQIISVVGVDADIHSFFVRQVAENRDFLDALDCDAAAEQVIVQLDWPAQKQISKPETELHKVLAPMYRAANISPRGGSWSPDLKLLRKSLDSGVAPRAYWTAIRWRLAFGGHLELLRNLFHLWAGLGSGRPVYLFLCVDEDPPAPDSGPKSPLLAWKRPKHETTLIEEMARLLDSLGKPAATRVSLDRIGPESVEPWIRELGLRCRDLRRESLARLSLDLRDHVREQKRLAEISAALRRMLQARQENP